MKTLKQLLNEANLTPAEMRKPHGGTGEARTDILLNLAKDRTPIELTSKAAERLGGTHFVVTDIQGAKEAIQAFKQGERKNIKLTGKVEGSDEQVEITNSDIEKSLPFGGKTGGAGAGTENTAKFEAAQCVYLAALLLNNFDDSKAMTEKMFMDAAKSNHCKITQDPKDLWQFLESNPAWHGSSFIVAKKLISIGIVKKFHVLHHATTEVQTIYNKKKIAFANDKIPRTEDDKWNPADIWAMSPDFDPNVIYDENTMVLKGSMEELFEASSCIGISLKKVVKNPSIEVVNYNDTVGIHKYVGTMVKSDRGTFWSSKSGIVKFDEGIIEIRPNNYLGSNKMEIKGKTARGGGIGWGHIVYYAKNAGNYDLMTHKEISGLAIDAIKELYAEKSNNRVLGDLHDIFNKVEPMSFDEMVENLKALGDAAPGWVSAKLAPCLIKIMFDSLSEQDKTDVVSSYVNHAASKMKISTVHVKAYEK